MACATPHSTCSPTECFGCDSRILGSSDPGLRQVRAADGFTQGAALTAYRRSAYDKLWDTQEAFRLQLCDLVLFTGNKYREGRTFGHDGWCFAEISAFRGTPHDGRKLAWVPLSRCDGSGVTLGKPPSGNGDLICPTGELTPPCATPTSGCLVLQT